MSGDGPNKFRAAAEVLGRCRDAFIESIAEEVIAQGEILAENTFVLNELLETHGTRLHFYQLIVNQFEQSAERIEEAEAEAEARAAATVDSPAVVEPQPESRPKAPAKKRSRAKRVVKDGDDAPDAY